MPIHSFHHPSENLTIHRVEGNVTFDQIRSTLVQFYSGSPTKNTLWDLTGGTIETLSTEQVEDLSRVVKEFAPLRTGGKTAWVAPRDEDFGLCRMSEIFGSDLPLKLYVFREMAEAREWLNIE